MRDLEYRLREATNGRRRLCSRNAWPMSNHRIRHSTCSRDGQREQTQLHQTLHAVDVAMTLGRLYLLRASTAQLQSRQVICAVVRSKTFCWRHHLCCVACQNLSRHSQTARRDRTEDKPQCVLACRPASHQIAIVRPCHAQLSFGSQKAMTPSAAKSYTEGQDHYSTISIPLSCAIVISP